MKERDFVNRVLLVMNDIAKDNAELLGADTAQIDKYIVGSYIDAWKQCVNVMPRSWFENKTFSGHFSDKETFGNDYKFHYPNNPVRGVGFVEIPDDFYLLSMFQMKGWVQPVNDALAENAKTLSVQSNEYTRGSVIRPVCVIGIDEIKNKPKRVLKYYSLPNNLKDNEHVIERAIYIPITKPITGSDEEELNISQQVFEPLVYLSASNVYTLLEKYDIAKALESKALSMFL